MAEQFFRYVPQHRVEAYCDIGWMVLAHIGQLGGVESVLMEWQGSGAPRDPVASVPWHREHLSFGVDEVACVTTRICFARRDWDSVYGFGTILIECRNSTDGARSVSKTLATGCV